MRGITLLGKRLGFLHPRGGEFHLKVQLGGGRRKLQTHIFNPQLHRVQRLTRQRRRQRRRPFQM